MRTCSLLLLALLGGCITGLPSTTTDGGIERVETRLPAECHKIESVNYAYDGTEMVATAICQDKSGHPVVYVRSASVPGGRIVIFK